jgi:diguanylate cyclase (GGDEF)-like protein
LLRTHLASLDSFLAGLSPWQILAISSLEIGVVFVTDYLTGYEVSISLLYLLPVTTASWYSGRRASVSMSIFACISWFAADISAGHPHQLLAIPVWNALVRLGFFLANGYLVVELRNSLFQQRELARTDVLTGVFARRVFEDRLEHDLDLARRNGRPLTIAYLDVDDFKVLNDTCGHNVGDQALRLIGQALCEGTRAADTVARLGGDEFAVVLVDTGRQAAEVTVAKLRRALREALQPVAAHLTCSIGAITFEKPVPGLQEAVSAADALMYEAKHQGKNRVVFRVNMDIASISSVSHPDSSQ